MLRYRSDHTKSYKNHLLLQKKLNQSSKKYCGGPNFLCTKERHTDTQCLYPNLSVIVFSSVDRFIFGTTFHVVVLRLVSGMLLIQLHSLCLLHPSYTC